MQGACTTQAESLSVRSVSRESTDPVDGEWRTIPKGRDCDSAQPPPLGPAGQRGGHEVLLGF